MLLLGHVGAVELTPQLWKRAITKCRRRITSVSALLSAINMVARIWILYLKTFYLVPGVPGFIIYYLVLIANSMGRIRFVKKVFKVSRDSWWDFCYSAIFFSSDGTSSKHHCQRIEQIVCSPNCDRVTRILRFLSKIFNLVPGVDQAYQDSHGIYQLLLGTNRKSRGQNSGSLKKF